MTTVSKRRILVIDDHDAIHEDYRKIICPTSAQSMSLDAMEAEIFGSATAVADGWDLYEIDSAFQGQDGLTLVEESLKEGRPYAVAFVDIRMPPGWDGVHTVRQIWQLDPEILIVLCSAHSDYSWQDLVDQLGRTDRFLILKKPFDNVEVRQCAAAMAERWVIARTDALTGILNRRAFEEHLRREWDHSLRHEKPLACVMMDIDLFKSVNDEHGHHVGDQTLLSMTQLLQQHVPPGGTLCRYGGEEFCILLPGRDEKAAAAWADEVRQHIACGAIEVGDQIIQLTVSGGVACLSAASLRQEDLIDQADAALRAAKKFGRNRVYRWADLRQPPEHREKIEQYAARFEGLKAGDLMSQPAHSIQQGMTICEAATEFLHADLAAAPVVNADGELVGILSDQDIVEALGGPEGWSGRVQQVMMPRVIHYDPETPADQVFRFLCRSQLRRVVITEQSRPVGIVSCNSFIKWFCGAPENRSLACCGVG